VALCRRRPIFILNGAAARARITAQAAIALSEYGVVGPTIVYQRTDFAASMVDGRTIQELDASSKGAAEIASLWAYVSQRMHANGGVQ
jgi:chromosome partitioning protein